jgi:hypothetical protein
MMEPALRGLRVDKYEGSDPEKRNPDAIGMWRDGYSAADSDSVGLSRVTFVLEGSAYCHTSWDQDQAIDLIYSSQGFQFSGPFENDRQFREV